MDFGEKRKKGPCRASFSSPYTSTSEPDDTFFISRLDFLAIFRGVLQFLVSNFLFSLCYSLFIYFYPILRTSRGIKRY